MIDKNSKTPLYVQVMNEIKNYIEENDLKENDPIPSERDLAEKYSISRMTIHKAINNMVNQGCLYRHTGRGTFVVESKIEHDTYRLLSFTEEMKLLGKIPKNKVLEFKIRKCGEYFSKKLNLDENDMIYEVVRIRFIENEPLILEETYMPVDLFPDLSIQIMQGSKYEYIEKQKNMKIKENTQEIIPIIAEKNISNLLKIKEGEPVLKVKSYSQLSNNEIFEYSVHYYRTSKYKFIQKASR